MKASRTIVAALTLLFVIGILSASLEAAPAIQGRKQEAKAPAVKASSMPKEVAAVIQEGLATRQGRQDMPFSFFKTLILPAQAQNLYPVFFFKAKNGDLGYAPSATGTGEMETTLNVFFQFFRETETGALAPEVTGRAVGALKTDGANYNPENEDWYSFAVTMPAGKFTLAMALTSPDMKKMSVAYCDVTLPSPAAYETTLWTTDPMIINALEQVEPDQRPTIHRAYFSWGAIKFVPNILSEVASGETLEIFFFILGGAFKDPAAARPLNDFEVNFVVQQEDGQTAIKWAPQLYEAYFVNQPLPLVQTLQITDDKGTRQEKKALDAGKYNLAIAIADKVSGKTGEAKLAFSVK